MKLQVTVLDDVVGVNDFHYVTEVESTVGDAVELFFQLSDATKNLSQYGFNPSGLRYVPLTGSTLQCVFLNINTRKQFARFATQPYPQDPSIWKVPVLATDPVSGTVSMKFTLTEPNGVAGGITRTCFLNANFLSSGTDTTGNPRSTTPWGF
jgi:hypothetical protein